ncbi:Cyclin_B-like protein [Hexamita inflata]|uniref:Cyclin B-like protein n=1 Tax=Hexamita inflata TaxID=28002 RepID=A0AA86P2W8_9EUKA|nr:Cyclin B-like protein [Hexamita inflata]
MYKVLIQLYFKTNHRPLEAQIQGNFAKFYSIKDIALIQINVAVNIVEVVMIVLDTVIFLWNPNVEHIIRYDRMKIGTYTYLQTYYYIYIFLSQFLTQLTIPVKNIKTKFPYYRSIISVVNQLFLITTSANSTSIRQFDNRNQKNKEQCRKMLSGQWIEITQRGQATQIYKKYCEDSYFKVALRTPIDDIDGAVQKIIAGM